ncbi:MAG: hypothetical protein KDA89_00100 [Planctomycetaceae bacterium]|nr:hypothetical protein [Planctomycetaceae bacterium]
MAPEFLVDSHSGFEKPEDSPLYAHLMALLAELRERYFVLSHSGCSGRTPNPKIEFGRSYAMLDQIRFPSWLEDGRDCHMPLKIIEWHDNYGYFAWSQIITQLPKEMPVAEVVDHLNTPVTFRGKTVPIIEVGFNGFLGYSDASQFLRSWNDNQNV